MPRPLLAVSFAATLGLALGCVSATVDHPLVAVLQGTWSGCANGGATDFEERIAFDGDAIAWKVSTFATTDASCGGDATVTSDLSGTYVVDDTVKATLDGTEVDAYGIDVTDATRTFYTTVYVDATAAPRKLYVGESDPASGRDMTSGAKRPIVLSAWKPLSEE
jgi:hypothetical protein